MTLPNDDYGRTITLSTLYSGIDTYTIGGIGITISYPIGTPLEQVYCSINGMAPDDWTPPWLRTEVPMDQALNNTLLVYADNNDIYTRSES